MVDNATLRYNARTQLGGNIFRNKWLMMLAVCAILPLLSSALSSYWSIGSILVVIISGPLTYGVARTTVECVEGEKWDISHAFHGFKEDFGGSLLLGFLQSLFIALWTLLLIIPGIVKTYSYAMAFYIKQEKDNKDMEAVECITESRHMMDGHKWQLFCLDFSFLGWYILGALCLGVGVFFVTPYHETARANFYEALKAEDASAQAAAVIGEPPAEEWEENND